jgi:hypothetical protein
MEDNVTRDLERELRDLREKVERLASQVSSQTADPAPSGEPTATSSTAAGEQLSALRSKFEDFLEVIRHDLDEVPTSSAIAIFALGILIGRMLPR